MRHNQIPIVGLCSMRDLYVVANSVRNSAIFSIYNLMSWCCHDLLCLGHLWHSRVCLLRWHKFHTWLKAAHTTLSNLWKSSRNSIENFIHSFTNFNILLHSLSYPLSPFLSMCMHAHAWKCVCVYPFIPQCLFPKHEDIILHNHS